MVSVFCLEIVLRVAEAGSKKDDIREEFIFSRGFDHCLNKERGIFNFHVGFLLVPWINLRSGAS